MAALLIAAIAPLVLSLGTGFLPEMDEGSLILDFNSPPGTSPSETERMFEGVERQIAATPEIAATSTRIGDQLGFFITEPNRGDCVLRLARHRRRAAEDVADDLRQRIEASLPALQIEFGQLIEDVVGDLTTNPQPIEVRRALQLRPHFPEAHNNLANCLKDSGHLEEAVAHYRSALEQKPDYVHALNNLANALHLLNRYDEAINELRKTIEMDPGFYYAHWSLGQALQAKGDLAGAIAEYQKAFDLTNDPYPLAALGQARARNGQKDEARKILGRLNEEAKSRFVAPYAKALVLNALGEKAHAIDELELAYREGTGAYLFVIKVDPFLDDLRGDPRFEALVQKITHGK